MIPERCRSCVHWLGHLSHDDSDRRCNRNWGHDERWGRFFDASRFVDPHARPAYVTPNCLVPEWGLPIPVLDDHGNPTPLKPRPQRLVDAFVRRRPDALDFHTHHGAFRVHRDDLASFIQTLTMDPTKLIDRFADVKIRRDKTTKANIAKHQQNMKSAGKVTLATEVPPYSIGRERIPTGLVQLDAAYGGGITPGTPMHFWGKRSTGKTTLANQHLAAIQDYYRHQVYRWVVEASGDEALASAARDDQMVAAFMSEDYDPSYADAAGIILEQLVLGEFEYGEQTLQYVIDVVKENYRDMIDDRGPGVYSYMLPVTLRAFVLDSLSELRWWSDDHGARDKETTIKENSKIGDRAQKLSQFGRMTNNMAKVPVTPIFITQVRTKMAATAAWDSGDVGNAFSHKARVEMEFKEEESFSGLAKNAAKDVDQKGTLIRFRQTQMAGGMGATMGTEIKLIQRLSGGFFASDNTIHTALELGVAQQAGSWIKFQPFEGDEVKHQGVDYVAFNELIQEAGVYEELYQRTLNVLQGKDQEEGYEPREDLAEAA